MGLRTQLIKNDDVSTKMNLSFYQEARLKVDRSRTNKDIIIGRIFGTAEYDRMIQSRKFMIQEIYTKNICTRCTYCKISETQFYGFIHQ